ncbi:hypothetical protein [Desulfolucanica intricata]|uniref:hypothetical protein n=1 Tax=Desulfolucanica intricata TaxID=1285191 RepID=UPI0008299992|nr:hypothetical protein [Desulfolucanica intricata]
MFSLSKRRRILGFGLILVGVGLLVITALGQWAGLGGYTNFPPRSWERFEPDLVAKTPDLNSLYRAAETRATGSFYELPPAIVMQVLYQTVTERFTHGAQAQHNLFSNWILGILGWLPDNLSREFAQIRNPESVVKYGHSALCGQQSGVLVQLAEKAGIDARIIGLSGHVVMEAYYDHGWHMYDPDMEIVPQYNGQVLSLADLETCSGLTRHFYSIRPEAQKWTGIITTADNNHTFPVGSVSVSPNYLKLEQFFEFLKWIIPVGFIILGFLFLKRLIK